MLSLSMHCGPQRVQLNDNQVLALKGRRFEITCLSGLVWITDGVGGERIIQGGQQATLRSKGRICVQAFESSVVLIQPQTFDQLKGEYDTLHLRN
ncbi:MAG: hypothetical protein WAU91_15645 [Desulfatitalea sp.]